MEFYNPDRKIKAPSDVYMTQTLKTDEKGIFVFGIPREGWWGFAALTEADHKMKRQGKEYPVEWAGVLWIRARRMP